MEDGADALADELSGGFDGVFSVLDEDRNFAGAGRFENAGKLSDGLLEDLGWANVDFGDYYHYWNVQGEGNTQMFSVPDKSSVSIPEREIPYLLIPMRPLFAATIRRQ